MKVKIGKYVDHWTVYTFTDKLEYLGISEDMAFNVGQRFQENKYIDMLLDWRNEYVNRKIKIHIDAFDVWSMDNTLSYIIAPMLEKLKEQKHGSAQVELEDVPSEYQLADVHERWDWVISELIWSFKTIRDDQAYEYEDNGKKERVANGLRLFGKYYFALWD